MKVPAPNRVSILRNKTCIYCGSPLNPSNRTVEHVIGRRFVPKGTLNAQWNLIASACAACNSKKSDLEDDLSAISMQADAFNVHASADPVLISESKRKGKASFSRRTGKPVESSGEKISIRIPFGNGSVEFGAISSAQLDHERAYHLAYLHAVAFFYFISFDAKTQLGYFWPGDFIPVLLAPRSDWGNAVLAKFSRETSGWESRFVCNTANEFFRASIKRHPTAALWSWCLEWNMSYRIAGFFGDKAFALAMISDWRANPMHEVKGEGTITRFREEVPLQEKDNLFDWTEDSSREV